MKLFVRAQEKVSNGRPNTAPKSCIVVTDPQVYCEITGGPQLNVILMISLNYMGSSHMI